MATPVDLSQLMSELQKVQNHLSSEAERLASSDEMRSNRNANFIIDAVNSGTLHTTDVVDRNAQNISKDVADTEKAIEQAQTFLGTQTERVTNELVTLMGEKFQNVSNNLSAFANNTIRDFGQVSKDISSASQKADSQFASLQLQSAQEKSEILSKIAQSTAEIKDKISYADTERIRDAMQLAETRNAVLQSSCYPPCCDRRGGGHSWTDVEQSESSNSNTTEDTDSNNTTQNNTDTQSEPNNNTNTETNTETNTNNNLETESNNSENTESDNNNEDNNTENDSDTESESIDILQQVENNININLQSPEQNTQNTENEILLENQNILTNDENIHSIDTNNLSDKESVNSVSSKRSSKSVKTIRSVKNKVLDKVKKVKGKFRITNS